jgi:glycosyltransferase involved in cell wall biosynthesis
MKGHRCGERHQIGPTLRNEVDKARAGRVGAQMMSVPFAGVTQSAHYAITVRKNHLKKEYGIIGSRRNITCRTGSVSIRTPALCAKMLSDLSSRRSPLLGRRNLSININRRSMGRDRLRIAQIAPLYEPVPPKLYGGTERVVSYITEELVSRGHQVSLFASGDSETRAKLSPGCERALRLAGKPELGVGLQLAMLTEAFTDAADRFDIVHSHLDYWSFPMTRLTGMPTVSTMHGRLDLAEHHPVYHRFPEAVLVSISDAQRTPLTQMNWVATIYHGLPSALLRFNPEKGKYLAFIGRISPEKRLDLAIEVAMRSGVPLKIAAKVDPVDREYFESVIKPLINAPLIEYIGEIGDAQKSEFLGGALALMFTIDWPEPFGLAMIEALACGTPVIARPCGSVPEVIKPDVTGFIAGEIDQLVAAVGRIDSISRQRCRLEFEERFTAQVMVDKYEAVYDHVLNPIRRHPNGTRNIPARSTEYNGPTVDASMSLDGSKSRSR